MQSLTTDYTGKAFAYTAAQITNTVNHVGSGGAAHVWPRFRLLQQDATSGLLTTVNRSNSNADPSDITQFVQSCTIANDTTQAVHRSCTIAFKEMPDIQIDPLHHLIQALVGFYTSVGTLMFEVPVGVFTLVLPDRDISDAGNTWTIVGLDLTAWISQLGFLNTYVIPTGTDYVTAVQNILTMDYVPKSQYRSPGVYGTGATPAGLDDAGPHIPIGRIAIPPTVGLSPIPGKTPAPIVFTRKDNKLAAINQLLDAINYYPLWVDEVGVFRSSLRPWITGGAPSTTWTYHSDSNSTIQGPVQQRLINQAELANIVEVFVESNNGPSFYAVRYNNAAGQSAISLSNLGRAVLKVIEDTKIPDLDSAKLRAEVELQYAATLAETIGFTTAINPFHQTHDYLDVQITAPDGTVLVPRGQWGFEETGWTMDLSKGGLMTHAVGRLVAL